MVYWGALENGQEQVYGVEEAHDRHDNIDNISLNLALGYESKEKSPD